MKLKLLSYDEAVLKGSEPQRWIVHMQPDVNMATARDRFKELLGQDSLTDGEVDGFVGVWEDDRKIGSFRVVEAPNRKALWVMSPSGETALRSTYHSLLTELLSGNKDVALFESGEVKKPMIVIAYQSGDAKPYTLSGANAPKTRYASFYGALSAAQRAVGSVNGMYSVDETLSKRLLEGIDHNA